MHKDTRTGFFIGLSYPPYLAERTMSFRIGDTSVLKPNITLHFMTGVLINNRGLVVTDSIVTTEVAPELLVNVPRAILIMNLYFERRKFYPRAI
ncbi:MAG: hypothetical protein CBB68_12905 [Rhodospirillaceae bacterium TMED8]|nr:hypothetical protein [Magnetovibrio sp.]OUT49006.1 MAG: hypothetical protein CBB68_12905 [Rhodospirillaceae bacterium TMED8]